jgi:hypothetical protein
MRRFISILLFAALLAFAFAYSSLLPQRAMAASSSTLNAQQAVQLTGVTSKPDANKRWGHGYWEGYHDGFRDGYEIGITACYDFSRHRHGWTDEGNWAYRRGYSDGFERGFDAGKRDCYDRGDDRGADHDTHHGHHGHHDDQDNHGHKGDHNKDTHNKDDRHKQDHPGNTKH